MALIAFELLIAEVGEAGRGRPWLLMVADVGMTDTGKHLTGLMCGGMPLGRSLNID